MRSAREEPREEPESSRDTTERDLLEDVLRIQASGGPDRVPSLGSVSPLKQLRAVAASARAAVDALRHIVQEPEDAAAKMCGGLVSKEYGAHEPAHTEHHLYRDAKQPPPAKVMGHQQAAGVGRGATDTAAEAAEAGRKGATIGEGELLQEGKARS